MNPIKRAWSILRSRPDARKLTAESGEVIPFVIMSAVLIMLIAGAIGLTRVALAKTSVAHVAQAGAREASIARSGSMAKSQAESLINNTLADEGVDCRRTQVKIDTSAFSRRVGRAGMVTAEVSCVVPLGDLVVPGLPGSVTVTGRGQSPLDTYRERP
jgi:Flp pilus assembly protein TadG